MRLFFASAFPFVFGVCSGSNSLFNSILIETTIGQHGIEIQLIESIKSRQRRAWRAACQRGGSRRRGVSLGPTLVVVH